MNATKHDEMRRCEREIAAIELALAGGHPDVAGLCLALSDWSAELRILREEAPFQGTDSGYFFGGL